MKNNGLIEDYFKRAKSRLKAIEVLFQDENWADVVRESQEACELILKAILRLSRIDPPRVHDVSPILEENEAALPPLVRDHLEKITRNSRSLRRDRELAFYGSEDLTPSEFYRREDATEAMEFVRFLVELSEKLK